MLPRFGILIAFLIGAAASGADDQVLNTAGIKLVRIAPGIFRMGQAGPSADYLMTRHPTRFDEADWDERPVHTVTLTQPFLMGATEVTNAQYERFDPAHKAVRRTSTLSRGDDDPVVNVSWDDAVKFCEWLSKMEGKPYRLPTEAEWEYACRAGTTTLFHTGDKLPDGFHKWFESRLRMVYFPDGKFPPECRTPPGEAPLRTGVTPANAWGIHDMHGNVEEWCLDWYGPYEAGAQTDPVGRVDGDFRVTRGGAHTQLTRLLRSANRSGRTPETRAEDIGFRVVQASPPSGKPIPPPPPPLNKRNVSQATASVASLNPDNPVFRGPLPYVKIPAGSVGPLFSPHNHSPAITECPNGDLLAIWFSCVQEPGLELCVAASRLRAGTSQWEPASPFWDSPDDNDHYPKLWWNGRQTLFFFVRGHAGNQIMTSDDNGVTWSRPRPIEPPGEFGNFPFRTREGFIVMPHDTTAGLIVSRDEGGTWTFPEGKGHPTDCKPGTTGRRCAGIHNAMTQLRDGSLLAFGRNNEAEVRAIFHQRMSQSVSADWGRTWTYSASPFPAIGGRQRPVLLRLREGPLLLISFTDQWIEWKNRKGMTFKNADGTEVTGYGMFLALSEDDGKTWPVCKLMTDGGPDRQFEGINGQLFVFGRTMAEPCGYLAACQSRDGLIQLITSRNHYVFNLAWIRQLPRR